MPTVVDPGESVSRAVNTIGVIQANARKQGAYNALARIYGPIAGDPEAAKTMQEYGQAEKTNPIAVQQKQAELAGTQETNRHAAATNPLLEAHQTELNREQPLAFNAQQGLVQAQTGEAKANTARIGAETQATQLGIRSATAAQDRATTLGVLTALSDTVARGQDVGAAFDQYWPTIAKLNGKDPKTAVADGAQLRGLLVADPQGTLDKMFGAFQAGGGAPAGSAGAGGKPKTLQDRVSQVHAMQALQERVGAVPTAIDQADALLSKMSTSAVMRTAAAKVPGTAEYQFEQLMAQVGNNLALTDLQNMRATGFSLGRVTIPEFQGSKDAYANMNIGQDPAMLRSNLRRVKAMYLKLNDNMGADISLAGRGIPQSLLGPTRQSSTTAASPTAEEIKAELARRRGGK